MLFFQGRVDTLWAGICCNLTWIDGFCGRFGTTFSQNSSSDALPSEFSFLLNFNDSTLSIWDLRAGLENAQTGP